MALFKNLFPVIAVKPAPAPSVPFKNLTPVALRPEPLPLKNLTPVSLLPRPIILIPPFPTIRNLGQQYEFQSYNADGTIITKTITAAQLTGPQPDVAFHPESIGNLSSAAQASEAKLLSSLKMSNAQLSQIYQKAVKIDYALCLKSQQSQPVDFNMLQTPSLNARVDYNFYTSDETNISTQEDQTLDPLLTNQEVPRQVYLTWDTACTKNPSPDFATRTPQEAAMVGQFLLPPRGVATLSAQNMPNGVQRNLSQVPPISRAGQQLKLVDTHDLEQGFNSTSNSRLFKNTATVTVNTNTIDLNTISFNELILDDL